MVFASHSNRCFRSGSVATCSGRTLMATVRSSRVSRASHTSPLPPTPIWAVTSYGPRRVPGVRAKLLRGLYGRTGQRGRLTLSEAEAVIEDAAAATFLGTGAKLVARRYALIAVLHRQGIPCMGCRQGSGCCTRACLQGEEQISPAFMGLNARSWQGIHCRQGPRPAHETLQRFGND